MSNCGAHCALVVGALTACAPVLAQTANGEASAGQGNNGTDSKQAVMLAPISVESSVVSGTAPVEGYVAEYSISATKMDIPIIATPRSITVISREQLEDRGAGDLTEALAYTTGLSVPNGSTAGLLSLYAINLRGFSAADATYRDGTQIQAGLAFEAPVEVYAFQRIEILRGPASVLYGAGQPGGIINLVTKRPTDTPMFEVGFEFGSYDHTQLTLDVSDKIDADGDLRYRLTGLYQRSGHYIDFVNNDATYIAPALTWEPSSDTSLTLLSHYHSTSTKLGSPAFPRAAVKGSTIHGSVPSDRYIGNPAFDNYASEEWAGGYLFEHNFAGNWTFRQHFRYRDISYTARDTFTTYYIEPFIYLDDVNDRTVARLHRARYEDANTFTLDNRLISRWDAGLIEHTVLVGLDYKTLEATSRGSGYDVPTTPLDIYDPNYGRPFQSIPDSEFTTSATEAQQVGLYVQDHIRIGEHWALSLGARQDWVESTTSEAGQRERDELSLHGGLVWLPGGGWAPYVSYSESFAPKYGTDKSTGNPFEPITGIQYEIGVRYRPPGTGLAIGIAAFRITRENALVRAPDGSLNPDGSPNQVQTGVTRSRGVELSLRADLSSNLQVDFSYTYLDVEVTEAGGNQNLEGNEKPDVAPHSASIWLDYRVTSGALDGLGLGIGVRYEDETWADAANTAKLHAATFVDAALRYNATENLRFQVTAENLLDEQKAYCLGDKPLSPCYFGQPRTVQVGLVYHFE